MRSARYRALTQDKFIKIYIRIGVIVEMRSARYRALTHSYELRIQRVPILVEMRSARYRALTQRSVERGCLGLTFSRNEVCPV